MADHVVVLRAGVIEQQGAPMDLYERPANRFVAGFIGSPAMNFVPAVTDAGGNAVVLEMPGNPRLALDVRLGANRPVIAGLRPEHLEIRAPDSDQALTVTIAAIERTGSSSYLFSQEAPELIIVTDGATAVRQGERIGLGIRPDRVHLFDRESTVSLRG